MASRTPERIRLMAFAEFAKGYITSLLAIEATGQGFWVGGDFCFFLDGSLKELEDLRNNMSDSHSMLENHALFIEE